MFKKIFWIILVLLAIMVGFIPVTYLVYGVNEGYLQLKSAALLKNNLWWAILYSHFTSGGIAILIGWLQFSKWLQTKYRNWHRVIGKVYFISAIICSISGFYVGVYATGGWVAKLGFMTVASIYFYTTLMGFLVIKKGEVFAHQNFMTYSYAVCLAAVSLRLMTPLSYLLGFDYIISYTIIAWSAWLPNLCIAWWINRNRESSNETLHNLKLT